MSTQHEIGNSKEVIKMFTQPKKKKKKLYIVAEKCDWCRKVLPAYEITELELSDNSVLNLCFGCYMEYSFPFRNYTPPEGIEEIGGNKREK